MKHFLLLTILFIAGTGFSQKIRLKVTGAKDTTVFLTKYYGSKLFYADTAEMKGGVVEFDAKDQKPGMFALYMPDQKYFEFIINNEEVQMETALADLNGAMKVKKSEENRIFITYIQFLTEQRKKATEITEKRKLVAKEDPQYKVYTDELDAITKGVVSYQENLIKTNPTKLVSKVIKASMEVKIPDAPKNDKGEVIDQMWQLNWYRKHFWDNIDLTDDRLVNTPVFGQKVETFFGKTMIVPHPDSILVVAIPFIDGLKKGSEVFKYTVDYLTNFAGKSNQMGMDKVYLNMVKRYYCAKDEKGKSFAFWMPESKIETACEDIDVKLKLVLGVRPPNIILPDTNEVWRDFYSLKSDYTILYFWEPDCGHCKKSTPKLQRLYEEKLKARNVEIFAVGKATGDDYDKWIKFIKDNKLSFINVALTQPLYEAALEDATRFVPKYTTIESLNYHTTYDVVATPRIFLLDKDKKIVGKQLSISQLEDMLDRLQNVKDPVKLFPPDPEDEAH
jgi:thiol-disulfide isomerase/thioredoxin